MVIDQESKVPISEDETSLRLNIHDPFGVEYKLDQVVTLEVIPVEAVMALVASALKVPVKGGVLADKSLTPVELTIVLVKLSL